MASGFSSGVGARSILCADALDGTISSTYQCEDSDELRHQFLPHVGNNPLPLVLVRTTWLPGVNHIRDN